MTKITEIKKTRTPLFAIQKDEGEEPIIAKKAGWGDYVKQAWENFDLHDTVMKTGMVAVGSALCVATIPVFGIAIPFIGALYLSKESIGFARDVVGDVHDDTIIKNGTKYRKVDIGDLSIHDEAKYEKHLESKVFAAETGNCMEGVREVETPKTRVLEPNNTMQTQSSLTLPQEAELAISGVENRVADKVALLSLTALAIGIGYTLMTGSKPTNPIMIASALSFAHMASQSYKMGRSAINRLQGVVTAINDATQEKGCSC